MVPHISVYRFATGVVRIQTQSCAHWLHIHCNFPCWCPIASLLTGLPSSLGVRPWALETGRPVGLISRIAIIQSNSVDRAPTGPCKVSKALMLGGDRLWMHISVGRMRITSARLLEKRWFVGVRATTTMFL